MICIHAIGLSKQPTCRKTTYHSLEKERTPSAWYHFASACSTTYVRGPSISLWWGGAHLGRADAPQPRWCAARRPPLCPCPRLLRRLLLPLQHPRATLVGQPPLPHCSAPREEFEPNPCVGRVSYPPKGTYPIPPTRTRRAHLKGCPCAHTYMYYYTYRHIMHPLLVHAFDEATNSSHLFHLLPRGRMMLRLLPEMVQFARSEGMGRLPSARLPYKAKRPLSEGAPEEST